MKTFTRKSRLSLLLCFAGLLSIVAPKAQAGQEQETNPPTRVARISYVEGSVSLQPGGQGDWGSAARNRPMTIGDKIWVDKDSRAELQAGPAAIHLGSMTALSFLNLDQGITQVRLAEGSINFRVSELREGDLYEVDAPNLAFTVKQAGAFRIDVAESGDSARVTGIRGEGEVTAGGQTYEVHAGERAEFNGADNVDYIIAKAPGPDGLDRWAAERDLKEDNAISGKYVSRDTPGYSDLDDYGDWRDEPQYGHVWYPREVEPDWAPYSSGYWNWVGPWGWTWVDYSPWGFAPFHYGRWNHFAGGWGWCPGPIYGPPIYGPAFVGFLGGGFGFGGGFGYGGGIGWFPLGFGEPFFPWFGCRHEFIERINERNTFIRNRNVFNTNIRNVNFVNARNVNAVTVTNRNTFMNGQAINRGAARLTPGALRGAQVTNSAGIKPTQHSSLGSVNIRSHVATPPAAVQNRTVIARTAPAQGASQSHVRTVSSNGLTSGRSGNSTVNSPANRPANGAMNQRTGTLNVPGLNTPTTNGSANRPANGAMNQRVGTANAPARDTPAMNGTANRPANGAMNQRTGTPNAPAHDTPATNGRPASSPNTSAVSPRQRELSQNRPPSAMPNSPRTSNATMGNTAPQRAGSSQRIWEAQGNATDSGRAPAGFGTSNRPANSLTPTAGMNNANRPRSARGDLQYGAASGQASRPSTQGYSGNRPTSSNNNGRSYEPPQRTNGNTPAYGNQRPSNNGGSYDQPQRMQRDTPAYNSNRGNSQPRSYNPPPARSYSAPQTYSAPGRSYSAPSGSYSAPSRSYSAPSGSYSAPSRSSGGGGGGSRGGGGGGSPRGGGGSASGGRH